MKKVTVFIFCLMALYTQAQNTFPSTGNVGIGTTAPSAPLDVEKTILLGLNSAAQGVKIKANFSGYTGNWSRGFFIANENDSQNFFGLGVLGKSTAGVASMTNAWLGKEYNAAYMYFLSNGNVGIGTNNPQATLDVNGTSRIGNYWYFHNSNELNSAGKLYLNYRNPTTGDPASAYNTLINVNGGNVGIGTTEPTHKLSVNGTIRAREILVTAAWADFVFDNNYKLRSLTEVEQFVKTNKHLPEIPSAQQVEKNGVQLGDISSKLLMKIEELTLYMIELKKENKTINEKIELLEKENALLKKSNSTH